MGHAGALNPASAHRSLGMGIRWGCGSQPPAGAEYTGALIGDAPTLPRAWVATPCQLRLQIAPCRPGQHKPLMRMRLAPKPPGKAGGNPALFLSQVSIRP